MQRLSVFSVLLQAERCSGVNGEPELAAQLLSAATFITLSDKAAQMLIRTVGSST